MTVMVVGKQKKLCRGKTSTNYILPFFTQKHIDNCCSSAIQVLYSLIFYTLLFSISKKLVHTLLFFTSSLPIFQIACYFLGQRRVTCKGNFQISIALLFDNIFELTVSLDMKKRGFKRFWIAVMEAYFEIKIISFH